MDNAIAVMSKTMDTKEEAFDDHEHPKTEQNDPTNPKTEQNDPTKPRTSLGGRGISQFLTPSSKRRLIDKRTDKEYDDEPHFLATGRLEQANTTQFFFPERVVNHTCKGIFLWNMVLLGWTILTAVLTPFEVAFLETSLDGLFFFNRVMDLFFLLDIILYYNLSYEDKSTGLVVVDRKRITQRYIGFWFWLDLIVLVPYDVFALEYGTAGHNAKLLRIIRLLRVAKLLRVFKASKIFAEYELDHALNYNALDVAKFLTLITYLVHVMGCGLVVVGTFEDENWEDANALNHEEDMGSVYLVAIYWATMTMSTIGYGDVTLISAAEMQKAVGGYEAIGSNLIFEERFLGYAIICMAIGASVYAYVVGQLCNLIVTMNEETAAMRIQITYLNKFMSEGGFPKDSQKRIRKYFRNSFETRLPPIHNRVLSRLSPGLQSEALQRMHAPWALRVAWLAPHVGPASLKGAALTGAPPLLPALCRIMFTESFAPGEQVHGHRQRVRKLHIVADGLVVVYRGFRRSALASKMWAVGACGTLGEAALCQLPLRHQETAVAAQFSTMKTFHRKDLLDLLQSPAHAKFASDMRKYAAKVAFRYIGFEVVNHLMSKKDKDGDKKSNQKKASPQNALSLPCLTEMLTTKAYIEAAKDARSNRRVHGTMMKAGEKGLAGKDEDVPTVQGRWRNSIHSAEKGQHEGSQGERTRHGSLDSWISNAWDDGEEGIFLNRTEMVREEHLAAENHRPSWMGMGVTLKMMAASDDEEDEEPLIHNTGDAEEHPSAHILHSRTHSLGRAEMEKMVGQLLDQRLGALVQELDLRAARREARLLRVLSATSASGAAAGGGGAEGGMRAAGGGGGGGGRGLGLGFLRGAGQQRSGGGGAKEEKGTPQQRDGVARARRREDGAPINDVQREGGGGDGGSGGGGGGGLGLGFFRGAGQQRSGGGRAKEEKGTPQPQEGVVRVWQREDGAPVNGMQREAEGLKNIGMWCIGK